MPQALIAVALFGLGDWLSRRAAWERRRLAAIAVTAPMVVLVVVAGWTTLRFHRALAQTGGIGVWTDAIYQVAADLDQPGAPRAFAADWGFRRNLQIVTQNRVDPLERFDYSASAAPNLIDQFVAWTAEAPDGIYLFHAPGRDSYPGNRDLFEEAAYRNGRVPTLVKTYFQRDGQPAIQTYVLKPYTPIFEIPSPAHTTDVEMGDSITLVGYDLSGGPGSPLNSPWVTLYWRAEARPQGNYKVFAHLLDGDGNLRAQHDSAPVYATHPTIEWARSEVIADRFRLPIPEDLPAGTYPLFIGMYDEATGERLPLVVKGERLRGDTLQLTDVTIE
jgi:hypothetical protein